MKYQPGDYKASHSEPIWRDRSNFIFTFHLGTNEGKNEWEQLWGRKLAAHRFMLCCIPFFAKDISLGDEIETDANFVFQRVIKRSGQVTLRIWFGGQDVATIDALVKELRAMDVAMEWSSKNLLAISALGEPEAEVVANYLQQRQDQGLLHYETGNTGSID